MSAKYSMESESIVQRIVHVFVRGPLAPLLLVVATAAGIAAVMLTPREEEPQIVVPTADVFVSFPGASAEEVEKLVATPLERLLWQVEGVEHVYSVSRRDGAVVSVKFFVGEDRERALVRLMSRIEGHRDKVPPGVAGWVVRPVDINDVPIVSLTLWSESVDGAGLRRLAEEVAARLDAVRDLSHTEIIGGHPREVRVEVDPEALAAHGLSALEVQRSVRAADAALRAGAFDRGDRRIPVLAGPFIGTSQEVGDLVIGAFQDRPVHLRDVAKIIDGPVEPSTATRITFGPASEHHDVTRGESFPAVTLALAKKRGTNAVIVAEEILARAKEIQSTILPSSVHMEVTRNYGRTADAKVDELLEELLFAIITVIALIAFALGVREALIVAGAVPITFALTLLVNLLAGYTINRVTLFALVLSLGLVVDDPIVDVENIYRHFKRKKLPPLQAVLVAVNEVRPPVIVATLAVIISFLPMLFITGMMGPYMRPMAINVPVAMLMSLVVAFTVTPWMSYLILKPIYGKGGEEKEEEAGFGGRVYERIMWTLLEKRWSRWALIAVIVALMGFAGVLVIEGKVPLKMLPYDNKSEFQVLLDMPEGTTLERTDAALRDVEHYLAGVAEVRDLEAYVGTASPIDFNGLVRHYGLRQSSNLADIRINLVEKKEREQQSHEITLRLRKDLEAIAAKHGAALKIVEPPPGPPVLSTIVAEVRGAPSLTYEQLVESSRDLRRRLEDEEGVVDVDDFSEASHQRIDYILDKEKAALHGVATTDVTRTLALALSGAMAATVHQPGERQPLVLRLVVDRPRRSGIAELKRLEVKGASGKLVSLGELGQFREVIEEQPIWHKDMERLCYVVAEIAGRPPAEVVFKLGDDIVEHPLPHDAKADWKGEGEWEITVDVFRDLGIAFMAALVGIYVLLVWETRSFSLPALIMLAIPLTAIGIMPGFWLLNLLTAHPVGGFENPVWFTATGMIGMIALAGIVVRNSIILVDFIKNRVKDGIPLDEAVVQSGRLRLRPIILTGGAAMLGAWPITLDPIFSGLAWSLIFGLFASTAFTIFVIPTAYKVFFGRQLLKSLEESEE